MKLVDIAIYSGILTALMLALHGVIWWTVLVRKWWLAKYDEIF